MRIAATQELSKDVRVTIRPQEDRGLYCPRSRACGDSRFVETQIAYASALRRDEGDARRESRRRRFRDQSASASAQCSADVREEIFFKGRGERRCSALWGSIGKMDYFCCSLHQFTESSTRRLSTPPARFCDPLLTNSLLVRRNA